MEIREEVMYERAPVVGDPGAEEFIPVSRETVASVDGEPAVRVTSLLEVDAFKRRCSDRFLSMPPVYEVTDDLYNICCVLPQDPTDEQLGDLAFRLSSFLEDAHRLHVDRRGASKSTLGALAPPMRMPIVHRAKLREASTDLVVQRLTGVELVAWPTERETLCMLYVNVPLWGGCRRADMIAQLDALATEHGLRCVEAGALPQD